MKLFRMIAITPLLAGTALTQIKSDIQPRAQVNSFDLDAAREYSAYVAKRKPDLSPAILDANSYVYAQALPDVRKGFAEKPCAGHTCSSNVLNQALLDTYVVTIERKNYHIIAIPDVGKTVRDTSDIYVWSDPKDADFKLLRGKISIWADRTTKDRFLPKSDYLVHIEKAGYEPFEGPCSNRSDEGAACGTVLKKKN